MRARKSLPFYKDELSIKKTNDSAFDVTIGNYDGAEVCELIGLCILQEKLCNLNIGLYRDDGLRALHNLNAPDLDRKLKDITDIRNLV